MKMVYAKIPTRLIAVVIFFIFSTAGFGQTFTGNNLNTDFGGANGTPQIITSTANVSLTGTIGNNYEIENVLLNINHTWVGDVIARLTSPSGSAQLVLITLDDNNNNDDNFTNTIIQDGGADLNTGNAPFTGNFQATGGLFSTAFAGENVNGNWTLELEDRFPSQDDGTLLNFEISFVSIDGALEFAQGDGNPTGNGPIQSTSIRFRNNQDNPAANTFSTYTPELNVDFTLTNHQYNFSGFAASATGAIGYANAVNPVFENMNIFGGAVNEYFTSYNSVAGSGIDVTQNQGVELQAISSTLNGVVATSSREQMYDIEINFDRPVDNPILHIAGLGGSAGGTNFSVEFDVVNTNTSVTLDRLSGTGPFEVVGNQINHADASPGAIGATAGSGSVRLNGEGLTSLTLRTYLRGDGAGSWSANTTDPAGDGFYIGFSVGESNLEISSSVSNTTPDPDDNVTFTFTAENLGTSNTTGVDLEALLPDGYSFVSANPSVGSYDSGTGLWTLGDLDFGDSETLEVVATVNATGDHVYSATIDGDLRDPDLSNNNTSIFVAPQVDTDGDGVLDVDDLDDDNDGILDIDEVANDTFNISDGNSFTFDNIPNIGSDGGQLVLDFTSLDNSFNLTFNGQSLNPSDPEFEYSTIGAVPVDSNFMRFLSDDCRYEECGIASVWTFTAEPVVRVIIDGNGNVSFFGRRSATSPLEPMYPELGVDNVTWTSNNTIVIGQSIVGPTNASGTSYYTVDTDGDGIPDNLDLDSDGDGCSDANEYYESNNADGGDDGVFGLGTPSVDSDGLVIAAGYDGTNLSSVTDDTVVRGCDFIQDVSGDWSTASNWNFDLVPTLDNNAIIRANSTVSTNQAINNLEVDPTYTVSINNGNTVNIKGDLTNNGDFEGDGVVVFDGAVAQNIFGDGTDAGTFTNIELDNSSGLTLQDDIIITSSLNVEVGDFVSNGRATFFCDFSGTNPKTAMIDELASGARIVGDVTTQQCFPGRRAFRFVTSTVTTTGPIRQYWQEDASAWNDNPVPGYGTHITGLGVENGTPTNDGLNGFDWQPSGNPSLFEFDNSTGTWSPIDNTDVNTLEAGKPYRIMIRGSRDVDIQFNASGSSNTILRGTGLIERGPVTFNDAGFGQNFDDVIFIGNPFQAIVDLELVLANSSNIRSFVQVWDPILGGVENDGFLGGRGAFTNIDLNEPNLEDQSSNPDSDANKYLQAYQGVYFLADGNGQPSIVFNESDKRIQEDQTIIFSESASNQEMTIKLYDQNSYNSGSTSRDAITIKFSEYYNNAFEAEDAPKMENADENLARFIAGDLSSYEKRNLPQDGEVLPLFVNKYRMTDYVFTLDLEGFDANTNVFLKDNYTDELHVLDAGQNEVYFTVNSSVNASVAFNRFSIVFENETLNTEVVEKNALQVYPNPVESTLNVVIPNVANQKTSIQIFDMLGKQVYSKTLEVDGSGRMQINNFNLNQGAYLLKVLDANGNEYSHKILKK